MTNFQLKIKGTVNLFGEGKLLLSKQNSVQPESQDIIRKALGGVTSARITRAIVFNDDTELATTSLAQDPEFIDDGHNNKVQFLFYFDKGSFEGTFNKIKMGSGVGIFSELTGFENTKTNMQDLKIEWTIEIAIV